MLLGKLEVDGFADAEVAGDMAAASELREAAKALRKGDMQAAKEHLEKADLAAAQQQATAGRPSLRVQRLPQRYQRLTDTTYAYESPAHDYRAVVQVTAEGAIQEYPGLFKLERRLEPLSRR